MHASCGEITTLEEEKASERGEQIAGAGYNRMKRFREANMEGWKKAVLAGSIGAATVLFLKRKNAAGVLAGGVALALLAAEYPEKFENIRESLPDYFDRGMQVMEMAAKAGRRITEAAGQSAVDAWADL
jgi:hypothetical protein